MNVPASNPISQDPSVPFNLLEALTTLRLRYEESAKEEASKSGFTLSTMVSYLDDVQWGGYATATYDSNTITANTLNVDKDKLAAAAGGGYNEEADTLNAPDVVEAVLQFKQRLKDQNMKGKQRWAGIVTERLERKVKKILGRGR